MPRGDKSTYSVAQKRKAAHIEQQYEARGTSEPEAERRAWATVNQQSGGGEKSGSGARRVPADKQAARSASAKRAATTRKRRQSKG